MQRILNGCARHGEPLVAEERDHRGNEQICKGVAEIRNRQGQGAKAA